MSEEWTIAGEYVECCNCSVPCQCLWYEAPDDNVCNAGVFWNIEEGRYFPNESRECCLTATK